MIKMNKKCDFTRNISILPVKLRITANNGLCMCGSGSTNEKKKLKILHNVCVKMYI